MFDRDVAPAGRPIQVRNLLAQQQPFRHRVRRGRQHRQRLLIEADRIVVGVDRACAIAGCPEIKGALGLVRAEAEMVAEHHGILKPLRTIAAELFEGCADAAMHVGPALQQEILIDHVVQQRLREPIGARRHRLCARSLLDDLCVAQNVQARVDVGRVGRDGSEKRRLKSRSDDCGFLGQRANVARQPVHAGQQQCLNACGNVGGRLAFRHAPFCAVAPQDADLDKPAHDLLDEQRVAAGALENSVAEGLR